MNKSLLRKKDQKEEKPVGPQEESKGGNHYIYMDDKDFEIQMNSKNMTIIAIAGDGNCLFRAVSDQVYGTENYYKAIRRICMDYVEYEKDFFKNYIVGGEKKFGLYLARKRTDGV